MNIYILSVTCYSNDDVDDDDVSIEGNNHNTADYDDGDDDHFHFRKFDDESNEENCGKRR